MKKIFITGLLLCSGLISAPSALAYTMVQPNQVGVATFQTFTLGVENEQPSPTIGVRLVVPDGISLVTPNVKTGWRIDLKKEGEGESAKITEVSWVGGIIPIGLRDEFLFSAKVPAKESALNWKVYQTYADGTVASWDQEPNSNISDEEREKMEKNRQGPYSITNVINDVKPVDLGSQITTPPKDTRTLMMSIAALVLSVLAVGLQFKARK